MKLDLALVMPVYNEQDCIEAVVKEWRQELERLDINFRLLVFNDGSTDHTADKLKTFAADKHVSIINKPNRGHGPTILLGYHRAVEIADWVFQCDSDNEISSEYFPLLWKERDRHDALFGVRQNREQTTVRKIITAGSRRAVRLIFGRWLPDVNSPYRLIRADILKKVITRIPDDTFAPNVIISGALARANLRLFWLPVPHRGRRTGTASLESWSAGRGALRSLWQTIRCRPRLNR